MASGGGSNLGAILDACRAGRIAAEVVVVISDRPDARALLRAQELAIPALPLPPAAGETRESHGDRLLAALRPFDVDLVVLAGYMRILSTDFVQRLSGRLLNIHPSLLPRHKGLHTHRRVLEAGEPEHGCTVHYVTPELDGGPAVLQAKVPVLPGDDETTLAARVLAREHTIYPRVLGWIALGRLSCPDGVPTLDGRPLTAPLLDDGSLA
ncbi:MAG: phosphoribosylglycinamide formyltransferase [Gammaproteobacteria bacterium]